MIVNLIVDIKIIIIRVMTPQYCANICNAVNTICVGNSVCYIYTIAKAVLRHLINRLYTYYIT